MIFANFLFLLLLNIRNQTWTCENFLQSKGENQPSPHNSLSFTSESSFISFIC